MKRLFLRDQSADVNEQEFWLIIDHLVDSYYSSAVLCHQLHSSGSAYWWGSLLQWPDPRVQEWTETIESQIGDVELKEAFQSLKDAVRRLNEIDSQIAEWLAGLVKFPSWRVGHGTSPRSGFRNLGGT